MHVKSDFNLQNLKYLSKLCMYIIFIKAAGFELVDLLLIALFNGRVQSTDMQIKRRWMLICGYSGELLSL